MGKVKQVCKRVRSVVDWKYSARCYYQKEVNIKAFELREMMRWETERIDHKALTIASKNTHSEVLRLFASGCASNHNDVSVVIAGPGAATQDKPSMIAPVEFEWFTFSKAITTAGPIRPRYEGRLPSDCNIERASKGFDLVFWKHGFEPKTDIIVELTDTEIILIDNRNAKTSTRSRDKGFNRDLYALEHLYDCAPEVYPEYLKAVKWFWEALELDNLEDTCPLPQVKAMGLAKKLENGKMLPAVVKLEPETLEKEIMLHLQWWRDERADPSELLAFIREQLPRDDQKETFLELMKNESSFNGEIAMIKAAQNL